MGDTRVQSRDGLSSRDFAPRGLVDAEGRAVCLHSCCHIGDLSRMPILSPSAVPSAPPDSRLHPAGLVRWLEPHLLTPRRQRISRAIRQRLVSVTVVLERPHDPHNGAAVLRSCEAMGLLHVHVVSTDRRFAISSKITQRADKWLNVYVHRSTTECLRLLEAWGFSRWAAAPPTLGSRPGGGDVDISRPAALVFGNEHAGLSDEALSLCDGRFHLPMHGLSESLNLSVSVALALQDATRRRRQLLRRAGDLPPDASLRLRAAYYARAVKHAPEIILRALNG